MLPREAQRTGWHTRHVCFSLYTVREEQPPCHLQHLQQEVSILPFIYSLPSPGMSLGLVYNLLSLVLLFSNRANVPWGYLGQIGRHSTYHYYFFIDTVSYYVVQAALELRSITDPLVI